MLRVLFLSIIFVVEFSALGAWHYKRTDADASSAPQSGDLTVTNQGGKGFVSVKQFCGVFGCKALYQWNKQRLILENPKTHKSAILSHVLPLALVDSHIVELTVPLLVTAHEGYLLPMSFVELLVQKLELGKVVFEGSLQDLAIKTEPYKLKILMLDPGHGGSDLGTAEGVLQEKDIALIYVQKLKEELKKEIPDLDVRITRDGDQFISLADRARVANEASADLFMSFHVNHAPDSKIHGAETFILSPDATDDESKKTALLENEEWLKTAKVENKDASLDLQKLFVDLEQQKYIQRSALFASYIQQELGKIENGKAVKNRGVKQAFFYVLSQAAMPSVLVEMGFLSHETDREQLMNYNFRDRFVKSVVTALQRYRMKLLENSWKESL